MEKFIPYEKLSKKEKRKIAQAKRQTWGELHPATRTPENSKAYNRKRTQEWKKELPDRRPFNFFCGVVQHGQHHLLTGQTLPTKDNNLAHHKDTVRAFSHAVSFLTEKKTSFTGKMPSVVVIYTLFSCILRTKTRLSVYCSAWPLFFILILGSI